MQFDDSLADGDVEMQKLVNRLSMVFTDEHTTELMISENEEYQEHIAHLTTKAELAKQKEMLAQKDKELEEKDNQLAASIKMLSSLGIAPEQIAENLKISVKTVVDLLGSDGSK
jgi:ABC-type phosphate transport system ATPase subunit